MQIKEEIKQIRNKIIYHVLAWFEDEGDYQPTQEEAEKAVDDIILSLLKRMQGETAEEICKLLDDIELKNEFTKGSTLEEWKQWKHIRNAIRDKFELREKLVKV